MLYISGNCTYPNITQRVYNFITYKYEEFDVEVYYCDLSDDNVKGWKEQNGNEILIHIDCNLSADEHIRTLFHEFIHCIQDIKGITDTQTREDEAYHLEEQYSNELKLVTSKVSL